MEISKLNSRIVGKAGDSAHVVSVSGNIHIAFVSPLCTPTENTNTFYTNTIKYVFSRHFRLEAMIKTKYYKHIVTLIYE
jgi:hypothetical protein